MHPALSLPLTIIILQKNFSSQMILAIIFLVDSNKFNVVDWKSMVYVRKAGQGKSMFKNKGRQAMWLVLCCLISYDFGSNIA
jgi:hypothetical protein